MNWLQFYLNRLGMSQNELAKRAGTSRQNINRLYKGEVALNTEWAERLAPHLCVPPSVLLFGPEDERMTVLPAGEPALVPVAGEVAAGKWLEVEYVDEGVYPPIPVVPGKYRQNEQRAFRVSGPSMDKERIFDGDFVITVPYWEARARFENDDIVIVERRMGHLVERTCKKVMVLPNQVELWPRSTHPSYQEPIVIPINRMPAADVDSDEIVEVIGLVIGRYTPM